MPAKFEKLGIAFQYPDNWRLDEEDALAGRESVTLYSPEGAFWSVALHHDRLDPDRSARAVLEAMKQEYKELEAEETREKLGGHKAAGYDVNFYYLDLIGTARIRSFRVQGTTYTVLCQAEDREFDQLQRVFEAITASLLSGLEGSGRAGGLAKG